MWCKAGLSGTGVLLVGLVGLVAAASIAPPLDEAPPQPRLAPAVVVPEPEAWSHLPPTAQLAMQDVLPHGKPISEVPVPKFHIPTSPEDMKMTYKLWQAHVPFWSNETPGIHASEAITKAFTKLKHGEAPSEVFHELRAIEKQEFEIAKDKAKQTREALVNKASEVMTKLMHLRPMLVPAPSDDGSANTNTPQ